MKSLSKLVLALYLLLLLWLVLFKFSLDLSSVLDSHIRSLNLIPFAGSSQADLRQMVFNFVVFIPFGLLLSSSFKQATFWQKLALIFMFSLAVETIQFICAIGVTDITDVITNTSGGLFGLALYALGRKYINSEKLDQSIVIASTILLTLSILFLGALLSHGVRYRSAHSQQRVGTSFEKKETLKS